MNDKNQQLFTLPLQC